MFDPVKFVEGVEAAVDIVSPARVAKTAGDLAAMCASREKGFDQTGEFFGQRWRVVAMKLAPHHRAMVGGDL